MITVGILFADDALIVVDKPPGVPSDVTPDPARPHLRGLVASQLDLDPSSLIVVHRLDRDTSGVLALARTPRAGAAVAEQFRSRQTLKLYSAVCATEGSSQGADGRPFVVDNHLRAGRLSRGRVEIVRSGGDRAITDVVVVERFLDGAFVEATPHTGRTHQIRVHLASVGLPIVGDDLYATDEVAAFASRTMLHARRLSLLHPTTNQAMSFEAALPDDMQECVDQLRDGARIRSARQTEAARRPANMRAETRRR